MFLIKEDDLQTVYRNILAQRCCKCVTSDARITGLWKNLDTFLAETAVELLSCVKVIGKSTEKGRIHISRHVCGSKHEDRSFWGDIVRRFYELSLYPSIKTCLVGRKLSLQAVNDVEKYNTRYVLYRFLRQCPQNSIIYQQHIVKQC